MKIKFLKEPVLHPSKDSASLPLYIFDDINNIELSENINIDFSMFENRGFIIEYKGEGILNDNIITVATPDWGLTDLTNKNIVLNTINANIISNTKNDITIDISTKQINKNISYEIVRQKTKKETFLDIIKTMVKDRINNKININLKQTKMQELKSFIDKNINIEFDLDEI